MLVALAGIGADSAARAFRVLSRALQTVKVSHFRFVHHHFVAQVGAFHDWNHAEVALKDALVGRDFLT